MLDLLYLTHNRLEFTKASLPNLLDNTTWHDVDRLIIYDDASTDGTREFVEQVVESIKVSGLVEVDFRPGEFASPVAVMNHYITGLRDRPKFFAKVDSDTMVPANWLSECLRTMFANPELSLLGIEAFNPVSTQINGPRGFTPTRHIGGIGVMRTEAFKTLPRPSGRFGFTSWQEQSTWVRPGWLDPALPVFLLDRLPREPWLSLNREYVKQGWARQWGAYSEDNAELWRWWCE